jgi:hypothetical protein
MERTFPGETLLVELGEAAAGHAGDRDGDAQMLLDESHGFEEGEEGISLAALVPSFLIVTRHPENGQCSGEVRRCSLRQKGVE